MTRYAWLVPLALALAAAYAEEKEAPQPDAKETVLGTVMDFEGDGIRAGSITFWNWPAEIKAKAAELSRIEPTNGSEFGTRALKLTMSDAFPWKLSKGADKGYAVTSLGTAYFPPETDVVRVRIKVVKGLFRFAIGGPTAYFGNSDAVTAVQQFEAQQPPAWVTADFSLNRRLSRNYRRSGFSTPATRIFYNRWAQEPTTLNVMPESQGEVWIDQIELVAKGEGRPFPRFAPEQVATTKVLADFEQPGDLARSFTALLADNQVKDFDASWTGAKSTYPPPSVSLEKDAATGRQALAVKSSFLEEIKWAGVKVSGAPGANAVRITVKSEYASGNNRQFGREEGQPLDFAVWVAPAQPAFPWERFGPSAELRKGGGKGFDYNLTYITMREVKDVPYALYHARRFVKDGEWSTLVIPMADFVCIWGCGAWSDRLTKNLPLNSEELLAVSFLAPWPRAGRGEAKIAIDEIALVKVPGTLAELRSYWQPEDYGAYKLVKEETGGISHYLRQDEKP